VPHAPLQKRLIAIVEPVCEAAGFELVDLRFVLEQGGWTLRVAVDLPLDQHTDPHQVPSDRLDLEDCESLSRELSAVLDVEDPIPQAFSLEVSSPGIDRPLRTPAHYAYFAGSEAKIQLAVPLALVTGERRNFRGILRGYVPEDGVVLIECEGTVYRLLLDDIEQAKLVPDWDAVMRGQRGVGTPLPRPVKPGHRASQKRQKSAKRPPGDTAEAGAPRGADPIAAPDPTRQLRPTARPPQDPNETRGRPATPENHQHLASTGGAGNDAENKEQG
jgi:ribosome maturation factor RimP